MNANLQIFSHPQFGKVRTLEINNNPYFVGNDVAICLGYSYPKDAIRDNVDKEDKNLIQLSDIQEGEQTPPPHMKGTKTIVINESGLYSLVFSSKLPSAKSFKRWVTKDVLPSIRKTGGYIIHKEGDTDEDLLARAFLVAQNKINERNERIVLLEQQNTHLVNEIKESAPKLKCYNEYISSSGTFTTTQIAKEYGWGAETLNKKLKEMGIQYKQNGQWILTAKYDGKYYTKSIPRTWVKSDGTTGTQMQTVWTSKGREFIHSLFKN